jgi:hypothetical protein
MQNHTINASIKEESKIKWSWIPQAIAILMLLWALNPENPYGYYILLRWICCAVFAFLTLQAFAQDKQGWAWTLGVTAVVYNPIIRIHLTREIWSVINVITIAIALASIFVLKSEKERKTRSNQKNEKTLTSDIGAKNDLEIWHVHECKH